MNESPAKKCFRVISVTALILKIITILTIIALLITVSVITIKKIISEKEVEESQIVAEIYYTDDLNEITDLEVLQDVFGIKIYDEIKANNNIITITILTIMNCIIEFILLIMIFDGVQKLFTNLYKTEEGLITDKNAKIVKNIAIFAILRIIIPIITNIITQYMVGASIRGNITLFQFICTLVIILVSFIIYYKIQKNIKEIKE